MVAGKSLLAAAATGAEAEAVDWVLSAAVLADSRGFPGIVPPPPGLADLGTEQMDLVPDRET